jgi:hypothetical protein
MAGSSRRERSVQRFRNPQRLGELWFLLTAIDGQINGGGGVDKFRIKIWDKNNRDAIAYDNQLNAPESADPTTLLGAGSIVIQK